MARTGYPVGQGLCSFFARLSPRIHRKFEREHIERSAQEKRVPSNDGGSSARSSGSPKTLATAKRTIVSRVHTDVNAT